MEFTPQFEKLSDEVSVCITPEHKFGTDAFLLADFAQVRHKDMVCDLGTGCGIIPLIFSKKAKPKCTYAVDIQPQAIEQLKLSLAVNQQETILPFCADLNALPDFPTGTFDVVTCNPPYKANHAGILSELAAEQIARHEVLCTMEDICRVSSKLLKFGGKLCLCQRPERLSDVITAMKSAGIEPKRLRLIAKNCADAPWLFLIEGKKGSKPFMQILPTLAVYNEGGTEFSAEMLEIYRGR